jgi:hypothetical protein
MSNNKPTFCVVVDASIARASGPPNSQHPIGTRCRNFLERLRGNGHRMAWSPSIEKEWTKHQSNYALEWLVSMVKIRKIHRIPDAHNDEFRESVRENNADGGVVEIILKDAHLVEAAWATDHRVTSLDDAVRGHLCRSFAYCPQLHTILWGNPAIEVENVLDWIENGLPDDDARKLKNYLFQLDQQ